MSRFNVVKDGDGWKLAEPGDTAVSVTINLDAQTPQEVNDQLGIDVNWLKKTDLALGGSTAPEAQAAAAEETIAAAAEKPKAKRHHRKKG